MGKYNDRRQIQDKITNLLNNDESESNFNLNDIIDNEIIEENKKEIDKPRELHVVNSICSNFWCKCPYEVRYYTGDDFPKTCPKCIDFDTTLSGGVESADKHYDGTRHDGMAHEVEFHFSTYKDNKGFWNK